VKSLNWLVNHPFSSDGNWLPPKCWMPGRPSETLRTSDVMKTGNLGDSTQWHGLVVIEITPSKTPVYQPWVSLLETYSCSLVCFFCAYIHIIYMYIIYIYCNLFFLKVTIGYYSKLKEIKPIRIGTSPRSSAHSGLFQNHQNKEPNVVCHKLQWP
jgi:hypothetical protein